MKHARFVALGAVAACLAGSVVWVRSHRIASRDTALQRPSPEFVGAPACRDCHQREYSAWESSQHRRAMQVAEPGQVLGDFDNARFTYGTVTSTFLHRDGRFWVRTDDADGSLKEFEIKYTFGVFPLQQYLIELAGGRVQALSVAWDSRPKAQGGQRWFHLYPADSIGHADELHWTGRQQNWNFMCADCHSTNVRKGYDAEHDRFQTTWSEINVGCEACHGPGSRHVKWARTPPASRQNDNGLPVHLFERSGVRWNLDPRTLKPTRSDPRRTHVEIDICAQCHARRGQIAEGYTAGAPFEDFYVAELLTPGLYYADGQQRDEVYNYGSFLQSRMAHAGVTCADCHEPHTERLRAPGNELCGRCHAALTYDTPAHHFHKQGTVAAQCVSCHMPARTYMVIDARRDHSLRVPRPDRSVRMGVPNACSDCHRDRTAHWADDQIRHRSRPTPRGFQTFAEAFHRSELNAAGAAEELRRISEDAEQPPIVRASALARLAANPGRAGVDTARRLIADPDPSVRRGALMVLELLPAEARPGAAARLLRDPVRSVRLQAAWLLAPASAALVGTADGTAFAQAADEFIASRRYRSDRPEDRTTLGFFLAELGRITEAGAEYRSAIRMAPRYTPAYVNLSDLQRQQGDEAAAERTLRKGVAIAPDDAALRHALGLSLVRSGRAAEAIQELKRAADLSTDVRFAYAYAVALHSAGKTDEALDTLERARRRDPSDRDVLFALSTFHRDAGEINAALEYANQLRAAYPEDADVQALVDSLQRARARPERR